MERFAKAAESELLRRDACGAAHPRNHYEVGEPQGTGSAEFGASLREIAGLAHARLQGLCVRLLAWRTTAQAHANDVDEKARHRTASVAPPNGQDGSRARLVDELFAEGLGAAMPAFAGSNLDSEYADQIENILIDLIKAIPRPVARSHATEDGAEASAAAAVLATLSSFRLLVIVGKVQSAVKLLPASDKIAAVRLVEVLGCLQLACNASTLLSQSVIPHTRQPHPHPQPQTLLPAVVRWSLTPGSLAGADPPDTAGNVWG